MKNKMYPKYHGRMQDKVDTLWDEILQGEKDRGQREP